MITINKTSIENAEKYMLPHKLWGTEAYMPNIYVQLAYDNTCFTVKFTVDGESMPLHNKTQHLSPVHEDSCVEFFANFTPTKSNHYINFEVNAGGYMNAAFRASRHEAIPLDKSDIESFCISPTLYENHWTVSYKIHFAFIKKYYPLFDINTCEYITGNFYKCGDLAEVHHYVSYFNVETDTPDYHRPDYFGKIMIGHSNT